MKEKTLQSPLLFILYSWHAAQQIYTSEPGGPQMDQVAQFTAAQNNENFSCSPSSGCRLAIPIAFPGRNFTTGCPNGHIPV